jgi:hypothetical protein
MFPVAGNEAATIVGDLAQPGCLPAGAFDCVIFTQTLQLIWDFRSALKHLHDALEPGGALLGSVPVISQLSTKDAAEFGEYWRFTSEAMRRLLGELFDPARIQVEAHGNVLAALGFLHGLGIGELTPAELDHQDPGHEVLVTFRAVR